CVMFEALTGHVPIKESTAVETLFKHITETIPPISEVYPEVKVPAALEAIASKCLANDPEKRYQSAIQLRADLLCADPNGKSSPPKRKKKPVSWSFWAVKNSW